MPISKPHSSLVASNKASCSNLAVYLEKENQELDKQIKKNHSQVKIFDLESRKQGFFSSSECNISTIEVIDAIDSNKKKLGKDDAKYFAPTISFSENELNHIVYIATGKKDISSVWELNMHEMHEFNRIIREYGRKVMDNYALNFNRQNKGINSGADLVYFAKIEHFRKFKGTDEAVLKGKAVSGKLKQGLQSHIHVIVSRKDKTQKLKLSPTCNEKATTRTIGENEYHVGFDRLKWTETNEKIFDDHFKYQRPELEKFKNQNILKNGSPQENFDLQRLIESKKENIVKSIISSADMVNLNTSHNAAFKLNQIKTDSAALQSDTIITQNSPENYEDLNIADIDKGKRKGLRVR